MAGGRGWEVREATSPEAGGLDKGSGRDYRRGAAGGVGATHWGRASACLRCGSCPPAPAGGACGHPGGAGRGRGREGRRRQAAGGGARRRGRGERACGRARRGPGQEAPACLYGTRRKRERKAQGGDRRPSARLCEGVAVCARGDEGVDHLRLARAAAAGGRGGVEGREAILWNGRRGGALLTAQGGAVRASGGGRGARRGAAGPARARAASARRGGREEGENTHRLELTEVRVSTFAKDLSSAWTMGASPRDEAMMSGLTPSCGRGPGKDESGSCHDNAGRGRSARRRAPRLPLPIRRGARVEEVPDALLIPL